MSGKRKRTEETEVVSDPILPKRLANKRAQKKKSSAVSPRVQKRGEARKSVSIKDLRATLKSKLLAKGGKKVVSPPASMDVAKLLAQGKFLPKQKKEKVANAPNDGGRDWIFGKEGFNQFVGYVLRQDTWQPHGWLASRKDIHDYEEGGDYYFGYPLNPGEVYPRWYQEYVRKKFPAVFNYLSCLGEPKP